MIKENIITAKEAQSIVDWAKQLETDGKMTTNTIGEGRFFCMLDDTFPVAGLKAKVKKAIGGDLIDMEQDFVSINKPGSHINIHKDIQIDGKDVIRGLVIAQAPEEGGLFTYDGQEFTVSELALWSENISTKEHGTSEISGNKDRVFVAFNFSKA